MKLLHAADLHIDSPLRGLERYEGAPVEQMRGSTRAAARAMVDLALDRGVDAVTIGGDIFDGDWPDINTGLWWNEQLVRLVDSGIHVFVVRGNHDAASQITRELPMPPGVHQFHTDAPDTVTIGDLGLAVHGQSYRDRATTDDLAARYPRAIPGMCNIGLLHTSLDGRPGHDPYAPCTLDTLTAKGYSLWALGHVHAREEIDAGGTHILYPGNTQGRHARETGPKGVSLIEFDDRGSVVTIEAVVLDAVRWERVEVPLGEVADRTDAVDVTVDALVAARERAGRPLAARVVLTGAASAHRVVGDQVVDMRYHTAARLSSVAPDVWVEKMLDDTEPEGGHRGVDTAAVDEVRALLSRIDSDDDLARELARSLGVLDAKLRGVAARLPRDDDATVSTVERVRRLAPIAAQRLISLLEHS